MTTRDLFIYNDRVNGMKLENIARDYGISRERVRQIVLREKRFHGDTGEDDPESFYYSNREINPFYKSQRLRRL